MGPGIPRKAKHKIIPYFPLHFAIFPVGIPYSLRLPEIPYRRDFPLRVAALRGRPHPHNNIHFIIFSFLSGDNLGITVVFNNCKKKKKHKIACFKTIQGNSLVFPICKFLLFSYRCLNFFLLYNLITQLLQVCV